MCFPYRTQTEREIEHFIEHANSYHPTIKFTAEVSQLGITFLDTTVYKGERFKKELILDVQTHYKPTETFQCTNFSTTVATHQVFKKAS